MKKKLLWVLVILICGLATFMLTSCANEDLPATALANSCYSRMFYGCTADDAKLHTLPGNVSGWSGNIGSNWTVVGNY
jgi:hypothetical protein